MKLIAVVLLTGMMLSGCEITHQTDSAFEENRLNNTAQELLQKASNNDLPNITGIIDGLESAQLNAVLVKVLQQWHLYQ